MAKKKHKDKKTKEVTPEKSQPIGSILRSRDSVAITRALSGHKIEGVEYADSNYIGEELVVTANAMGGTLPCWIFRPNEAMDQKKTVVYLPGSGFQNHMDEMERRVASHFHKTFQCRIVVLRYPAGSFHKHPESYNAICFTLNYLLNNHPEVKKSKIAFVGDSSGGLLALLICLHHLKMQIRLPISQLILFAPAVDAKAMLNLIKSKDEKELNPDFAANSIKACLPQGMGADSLLFSPMAYDLETFAKLPPIFLEYGTSDLMCETLDNFAEKIKTAGRQDRIIKKEGMPHIKLYNHICEWLQEGEIVKFVDTNFEKARLFEDHERFLLMPVVFSV